jgi:hypothetical protein
MDSTVQTALRPQKYSSKLLPLVTHGYDSANSPSGLGNHHRKSFHEEHMDLTAQTAPAASKIFNETVSTGNAWIRQRKHHYDLRNLQQNCFHG